eukprot:CAMPEP_0170489600 /NCGR_PEP_ID=MMETSP0208-20121228/7928_1 /TAXON_ID=197538 /ORGANISM="Strombidium inclinatum, Strain S3" /LENGTH=35 /DNA_ID= /DNA_START= /DNA_END= /DNA_ORIENTATION=
MKFGLDDNEYPGDVAEALNGYHAEANEALEELGAK